MILDREKALRFLKEQRKLMNYMNSTLSVLSWDTEVMAPEEAIDYRSEVIGYLSSNYHQLTTDYRIEQALGVLLSEEDKFNLYEQRLIEEFYNIYYKNKYVIKKGIQLYERWNSKEGIKIIKTLHFEEMRFQKYAEQVIEYLERDGV